MVENSQLSEWVRENVVVDGLISIYKPYGIPSTALTELYKRVTKLKVGHGGTLDPLAEGAMLLGIGPGTKLLTKYLESEKRYRAVILVGATTASGDLELPLQVSPTEITVSEGAIQGIMQELEKGFTQELPALNASKQNGKTAYSLVRDGKPTEKRFIETKLLEWKIFEEKLLTTSELLTILETKNNDLIKAFEKFDDISQVVGYPARKYRFMLEKWQNSLNSSRIELEKFSDRTFLYIDVEVFVPKGTYIRSLSTDIASRLGSVGMLLSLVRLSAGNY